MFHGPILCIPRTEAIRRAGDHLCEAGFHVTRTPAPDISHVLLPVPSFSAGDEYLAHFLADLPDNVIISGGNLSSPLLEGYATIDFLKDPYYLAENAAVSAPSTPSLLFLTHNIHLFVYYVFLSAMSPEFCTALQ